MWWPKRGPAGPDAAAHAPEAGPAPTSAPSGPRAVPFHPLLIAAFPVLALYANNIGQIQPAQIVGPVASAMVAAAAAWLLASLLMRSTGKGALAASAIVAAVFSYGHARNLVPAGMRTAVAPLLAAGAIAALVAVWRQRGIAARTTSAVNLAALVLVLPSCWAIGASLLHPVRVSADGAMSVGSFHSSAGAVHVGRKDPAAVLAAERMGAARVKQLPDVYYIILDAYGRADQLETFYGYDNQPFIEALEERGFYVPKDSHANYNQTGLCLASSLNLEYLDPLAQQVGTGTNNPEPLRRMIDDNGVAAYLRGFGYRYVYVWTGSEQTRVETADLEFNGDAADESFDGQMAGLTGLEAARRVTNRMYERHREYIDKAFRSLDTIATLPHQKFVFVHIMAPHPPFVFGPNGEPVNPPRAFSYADGSWLLKDISKDEYRAEYVAQLKYINTRVVRAVDSILQRSRRPPIIVLQGDHGSRMSLDWDSEAGTDLREPFSIFNAYHVPAAVRRGLYADITPVNSFRVLLDREFGARYPLLPDRSFYSTAGRPYAFAEVTSEIPGPQMAETAGAGSPAPRPAARRNGRTAGPPHRARG